MLYPCGEGCNVADSVSFTFKNTSQMRDKLKSLAKEAARKSKAAPLNEAYKIMEDSQQNYVPVDKGDLKNSGQVTPNVRGNNISITLSYGDEKTDPYAVAVHEHPS